MNVRWHRPSYIPGSVSHPDLARVHATYGVVYAHPQRNTGDSGWLPTLRLPLALRDATFINDTIRREHSPPFLRRDMPEVAACADRSAVPTHNEDSWAPLQPGTVLFDVVRALSSRLIRVAQPRLPFGSELPDELRSIPTEVGI